MKNDLKNKIYSRPKSRELILKGSPDEKTKLEKKKSERDNLRALERDGFVEAEYIPRFSGGYKKIYYRLTDKGSKLKSAIRDFNEALKSAAASTESDQKV